MENKTYKRETAWALLAIVMGMAIYGIWNPQALAVATMLAMPVFMFAGAAFGLDAYAKQIK